MKQRTLLFFLILLSTLPASAYDAYIDGIYYNFINGHAEVTYNTIEKYSTHYAGDIVIPDKITYNEVTYSVTSIGEMAFYNCAEITSVKIGKEVTSIGTDAFNGCSNMISVDIPNSVDSIGCHAFYGCKSLRSIIIPESVESIETFSTPAAAYTTGNPFSHCESLESIIVEKGNHVYDSRNNCNAIIKTGTNTLITGCKNTLIPNDVCRIGNAAFEGCTDLVSLAIPTSVTSIDEHAFSYCTGLTSIAIPDNVVEINSSAFQGCSSLSSVKLPNSITSIERYVFAGCKSLTSIIIPDGVTAILYQAFSGCTDLASVTIPNSLTFIGGDAFKACSSLITIAIPNSVKSIGSYAFQGCSSLTSMVFPNNITSIESYVLSACPNLSSVTIPNNVTSISNSAFLWCDALMDIYNYAFTPQQITSTTFPNLTATLHVVKNHKEAFESAEYWEEFSNIVDDLNQTGACGENAIYSLDTETGVLTISGTGKMYDYNWNSAPWYSNRQYIKSIEISEGITSIGNCAFYDCTGLMSITVPRSIVSIGNNALWNNSSLTSIILPDNIESMGYSALPNNIWIGANRGTKTLLVLWKNNYTPFDIGTMTPAGNPPLESPCLILSSITQTTATCKINNIYEEYSYEYRNDYIDSAFHPVGGSEFKMTGLVPEMSQTVWLSVSKDVIWYETSFNLVTKEIKRKVKIDSTTASSISAKGSYVAGDAVVSRETIALCSMKETTSSDYSAYYTTFSRSVKGDRGQTINYYKNFYLIDEMPPCEGGSAAFLGLNPSTGYYVVYSLFVELASRQYQYSAWAVGNTQSLTLTTQQPKVISLGNVIVAANSNLDDEETNVGFEWRRADWTSEFISKTGNAYMYECTMEGYIRNLYYAEKTLWKFRPYYKSNSETMYYGDWVGIDPTDISDFEPTVHTYASVSVEGNSANVRGYAMRGTDNIVSQGFNYWSHANSARGTVSQLTAVPSNARTVDVTGNIMTAELADLDYATEYHYVAYVTTSENESYYGEERTFTTDKIPSLRGDANGDGEIGMPDVMFIVNYILGTPDTLFNKEAADANQDGEVGMPDVMYIVNYILNGKFPDE